MIEVFAALAILATLVEFIVERIKSVVPVKQIGKVELAPIYAMVISIALGITCHIDLLSAIGLEAPSVVGEILSGLAISGGSGLFHELTSKVRESRNANNG